MGVFSRRQMKAVNPEPAEAWTYSPAEAIKGFYAAPLETRTSSPVKWYLLPYKPSLMCYWEKVHPRIVYKKH